MEIPHLYAPDVNGVEAAKALGPSLTVVQCVYHEVRH